MRVIAGSLGGRPLKTPKSDQTRPTTDRVKEALFSSLQSLDLLSHASFIDAFCGTGSIGIEAISRGVSEVVFVDDNEKAVSLVKENLESLGLVAKVVKADAISYLLNSDPADLVFADPPYSFNDWNGVFSACVRHRILITETDHPIESVQNWSVSRSHRYGTTYITMFENLQLSSGVSQ